MGGRKRLIRILSGAGVVLLGGLTYLFFQVREAGDLWPYDNEPGTLTRAVSDLENEVRRLEAERAKIPAAREELERITVEYDLATRVLPRQSSPDQLLAAIRIKAVQAGVVPDRVTPNAIAPRQQGARRAGEGAFEEWSFSLSIKGSYDQIATFVNRMEEFESTDSARINSEKWFFQVKEIDITAEDNGLANLGGGQVAANAIRHQCNLIMQTYRYTGTE